MDATTPTDADATPATDSAPDAPTAKAKTPTKRPSRAADDSLKETFESIVIAFILAFVFRAYVVEAFVIPTGSMAPTLLGQHMRVTCPACGYMFAVDPDNAFAKRVEYDEAGEPIGRSHREVICPMSGTRVPVPVDTLPSSGDRILVHKFIYSLVEPQRWDVVVFKNPANPDENYIKRLVGLPDEQLWIIEGNIYVKHADADDDAWQIARKSRRPKVQRSVFVPVYHSEYVPVGTRADGSTEQGWRPPWTGDTAHWDFATPRHYRMTTPGPATLSFDFGLGEDPLDQGQPPDKDRYTYNQIRGANRYRIEPVEDVRVAATFSPRQPGLAVTLTTTARTDDLANNRRGRRERIAAQISADGEVSLRSQAIGDDAPPPVLLAGPVDIGPFAADRPRRVELWLVDQEASVWIDGRRVLAHAFDLPIELVKTRPTLSSDYPEITIDCAGSPVTLHSASTSPLISKKSIVCGFKLHCSGRALPIAAAATRSTSRGLSSVPW